MFMEMARIVAQRGTCPRLCVGAVVVIDGRVVSHGYNGAPSGKAHCTHAGCDMSNGSCHRAIHAEINALAFVPESMENSDKDLYVTHSPCVACSEAIVHNGTIRRVFFESPYKGARALAYLQDREIKLYRVMPNGYVVDGGDGEIIEAN